MQFLIKVLSTTLDMPWVAANEVRRFLAIPWIRLGFLLNSVRWGKGWFIYGMPVIQRFRGSRIIIGDRVVLRSWKTANPVSLNSSVVLATRKNHASIQIGDDVGITSSNIVAAERIEIGSRVLIGANCLIIDTDFHPLSAAGREVDINAGKSAPVCIGNDVFIGMNSLILKGSCIGDGAVIGAGSVVAGDVPPGAIAAGNPFRIIR